MNATRYRTKRAKISRPAMIAPSWLSTPTQPIAVDDVIAYLKKAPELPESTGREIQIGGPDVLSYGDMLDRISRRTFIKTSAAASGVLLIGIHGSSSSSNAG